MNDLEKWVDRLIKKRGGMQFAAPKPTSIIAVNHKLKIVLVEPNTTIAPEEIQKLTTIKVGDPDNVTLIVDGLISEPLSDEEWATLMRKLREAGNC